MAGELPNRLAELKEQRSVVESALTAISQKLPFPDQAVQYINTRLGLDSAQVLGKTGYELLMKRLDQINHEIRLCLPFSKTKRVASIVNVLGKDLSRYKYHEHTET